VNPEVARIAERNMHQFLQKWEQWGPFVAERSWGTVREDYSADGDVWKYFPHDHAYRRAYRWGEDGIAALCDRFQVLVFAPAFWNGKDPILKERLFGLTNEEGNHGEDVKEQYYYLDGTPTGSYLKYLYKYPQSEFPYAQLVKENGARGQDKREFEILDTGVFDQDKYFDIFIEYAKADPEDICIRIEAINRGQESAPLHLFGQLWFRNQWAWKEVRGPEPSIRPHLAEDAVCIVANDSCTPTPHLLLDDYHLGERYLYASPGGEVYFTNNETNNESIWKHPNHSLHVKDAFHRYVIQKEKGAINPDKIGTKAAIHYEFASIAPGKSAVMILRLSPKSLPHPLKEVESMIALRKKEADQYYEEIHPKGASLEEKMIQRQSFAGMNWNKQSYHFSVATWMQGDFPPPPPSHQETRNGSWYHLFSMRILAMPDKWEYPWFAAWDLAFHSVVFGLMDISFAKTQLHDLLTDRFQHPNGQIPAYEWEFSDVNPPVQAWAALKLFEMEEKQKGTGDHEALEKIFHRLLLNFAWWINRVDEKGNNVFQGGFLGMDNIGFSDRSSKLPPGVAIDEVDGAGWMAFLSLCMMRIALTLSTTNRAYEGMAIKFLFHFLYIGASMRKGKWRNYDLWSREDSFFHSYLRFPDGSAEKFPVRSFVGVVPLFACEVLTQEELDRVPEFHMAFRWLKAKRGDLASQCMEMIHPVSGKECHLLHLLNDEELSKTLNVLWDPNEFRSEYGLRSLSKAYENTASTFRNLSMHYEPGESREKIKGGNSNWRGPIWFSMNYLFIETLMKLSKAYGNSIQVKTGTEKPVTIQEVALYYGESLLKLFKKDPAGRRPIFGDYEKLQKDPHFQDYILFYEHFHPESGRGLGASHLTGWTGLIANILAEIRKS
jgi:hypothetical protein